MSVIETTLNEEGILTLMFNREEKLNALNDDVLQSLDEILDRALEDKGIKALLMTGKGKAFCSGADITRLKACDALSGFEFSKLGQAVFRKLETLGKPSLAAVNGLALGGGCELSMAATFRIAGKEALFGQPEVKLGVIPGYGGSVRLPRLVGQGRALDLCLTGRMIDADTALSWGLVSQVVPNEQLLTASSDFLITVLKMAPLAVQSVMEMIDQGITLSLDDAMHLEALQFSKVSATYDKIEGVNAFLEKRIPSFEGR